MEWVADVGHFQQSVPRPTNPITVVAGFTWVYQQKDVKDLGHGCSGRLTSFASID